MQLRRLHKIPYLFLLVSLVLTQPLTAAAKDITPVILLLLGGGDESGNSVDLGKYNAMGLVSDTYGQPINLAEISSGSNSNGPIFILTSSGGAFYGDVGTATDKWIKVSADGYAETYTNSLGTVNSINIFETRLTPLGAWKIFTSGVASSVSHGNVNVELPAGLFAANATVSVTDVAPEDLDASYALMNDNMFYTFLRTFSVTALDGNGSYVPFVDGQFMKVTIKLPQAVAAPPPLAYFDAENGVWQKVDNICTLDDSTHMTCNLPHLSVWGAVGEAATTAGVPVPPFPNPNTRAEARANIRYGMSVAAQGEKTGDADMHQTGLEIMYDGRDKYVQLAEKYAANHQRDESGKMALLDAAAINDQFSGSAQVTHDLVRDAVTISENIGKDLLEGSGCGKVREMMQAAAQIEYYGGSIAVRNDLLEKINTAKATCDPWIGQISARFFLADAMPLVPDYNRQDNAVWTETHDVILSSNPSSGTGDPATYTLTGEDNVNISLPETIYETTFPVSSCPDGFDRYTLYSSPESSAIDLVINGFYSPLGSGFTINNIGKAAGGANIDLLWSSLTRTYIYENGCTQSDYKEGPNPYINGYGSLIGNPSIQAAVPITLQEMLNNGKTYSTDISETIYGIKIIQLSIPEYMIPWSSVQNVYVSWKFTHIKQKE